MQKLLCCFLTLLFLASTHAASAGAEDGGTWTASGSVGVELRWFSESPVFPGQLSGGQSSATLEPEWRWQSTDRRHQVKFAGFGRVDGEDDERTHVDVREASYRYSGDSFELLAGVSRVFWGVTESRHLVDVINQTDAVEDVDEEDRLGQPMIQLAFQRDWGRLELLSLLGFRERTFPGLEGRLRSPLPVDNDRALYESSAEDERIDWALRWSHFVGSWDLGAHIFHGTGREPRFLPITTAGGDARLVPFYQITNQVGIDVQYTQGAWLGKLELLAREGQGLTFGAAVVGFERTFYQIGGTAADLGLLVELLWDDRDATAPPTLYDNDTFIGTRLAANDYQSTTLLIGAIVDNDDQSIAASIEAERRVGEQLTFELIARLFPNTDPAGDLAIVDRDGFVQVRVAWHW